MRVRCFLLYWAAITAAVLTLSLWVCSQAEGSLSDCHDATCRISDGGTGVAFRQGQGHIYVLTNAHVVDSRQQVSCEFWRAGYQSVPLTATVVARVLNDECDAAVLAIPTEAFAFGQLPKIIPLAQPGRVVRKGETILTVGCPRLEWATGLKGHALGYLGSKLIFRPTPAGGRSGSAIFDGRGEEIVGLLSHRDEGAGYGLAVSVQALREHLATAGKQASTIRRTYDLPLPIPPERRHTQSQCPNGKNCPIHGSAGLLRPESPPILPWRKGQEQQPQPMPPQSNPTYPGLPVPMPAPAPTPSVDLSPLHEQLGEITKLLQEMKDGRQAESLTPMPEAKVPRSVPSNLYNMPDGLIVEQSTAIDKVFGLAGENQRGLLELGESVEGALKEVKTVKEDVGFAKQIAGEAAEMSHTNAEGLVNAKKENGSVVERLQARIAQAKEDGAEGTKEVAKKVVWDIIKSYGLGPVGVIGVVVFLIYRRINTGESVVRRLRAHAKRGRQRISKLRQKMGEDTDADDEADEDDEAETEVAEA